MSQAILQGIIMGLILSTFCGPIFFMLINLGVSGNVKSVLYLSLGVFVSDIIITSLLLFVAIGNITELKYLEPLYYVGGGVLIFFGIRNLIKGPTKAEGNDVSKKDLNKLFVRGFVINSFNPNVFFFWFGSMMVCYNTYHQNKNLVMIHFIFGLLITVITDFLKGYLAFHLKKFVTPQILKILNILSGLIIIGFGLKLIFLH